MLECNLMDFYGEGHSHLDPMCLGKVIFSAKELTKEPTAANEAAFLVSDEANKAATLQALEERSVVDDGQDRYLKQLRDLYAEDLYVGRGSSDRDVSLTKEFLGDLQDFVGNFRQKHSLN